LSASPKEDKSRAGNFPESLLPELCSMLKNTVPNFDNLKELVIKFTSQHPEISKLDTVKKIREITVMTKSANGYSLHIRREFESSLTKRVELIQKRKVEDGQTVCTSVNKKLRRL